MESKLKIYNIDSDYINFLQSYELSKRGFTKVSHIQIGVLRMIESFL